LVCPVCHDELGLSQLVFDGSACMT
jgi:hypothetical protein